MLMEIKTVQAGAFKTLIEAMKDILIEAPFEFDETGLKVMAMDNSHTVLVYVKLNSKNFEVYNCKKAFTIGVHMSNMYKVIKTMIKICLQI